MQRISGTVVMLGGDDRVARQLTESLRCEGTEVIRTSSVGDAWLAITRHRPQVVVVDLTSRSVNGEQLLSLSVRTRRAEIPLLLLSRQNARELAAFVAVIRARDVLRKTDPIPALTQRIHMWVAATQSSLAHPSRAVEIFASAG